MKFSDIKGNKKQIEKLVGMADRKKVPHALLLHGPAGAGKMLTARAFIQYLNCENPVNGDSCGRCPSCLQTEKLNNPDVHYIYPVLKRDKMDGLSSEYSEEWKQFLEKYPYMPQEQWYDALKAGNSTPIIYVAESAEILRLSSLSSYGKGYKIFLVWLPEKMRTDAANKLLKVIEEPFEDTLFIFVSNNPSAIISTIRSRLQSIEFSPFSEEEVAGILMQEGKSESEARSIARISKGNLNTALLHLENGGELEEFSSLFIGVMRAAYARMMVELRDYADKFSEFGREKSIRLLDYFARMVRESFISNLKCERLEGMTATEKNFVERFGPFINAANVEELSSQIDRAREDISRNGNLKIIWFDFLIELTRLIRTKGVQGTKR